MCVVSIQPSQNAEGATLGAVLERPHAVKVDGAYSVSGGRAFDLLIFEEAVPLSL